MSVDFEAAGVAEEAHEVSSFEMVEEALFSSLVLLGLSPELAERKYGCSLTPDMFRASNSKGLEAVLHFLLNRVAAEAKDAFRILWPISDQKQAREFRRVVSQALQKLERENHIPSGSFRASHLTSASGERLCIMLWHLANYAMKATLLEETNSPSLLRLFPSVTTTPTIPNLETIKQMTSLRISQQTSRFVQLAEQERQEERLLHDLAFSLQQEYRAQAKRKLSLAQQAKELESHAVTEARLAQRSQTGNLAITGTDADAVPNEQVQAAWTAIVQHLEDWKVKGEVLERVMDNKANCVHLDGKQLGSSSHRTESRDLDLVRLMHDWNAQLEAIYKKMTEMKNLEAKSRRRELASGGPMTSHGMKERVHGKEKENMGPQGQKLKRNDSASDAPPMTRLEELAHKLAQVAQQHDQQVGVIRTVMDGVAKEEMVQMRDMIESLSKVISNSDASSKMESQLRSLLSMDGEEASNSSMDSLASRPLASATKSVASLSMTPRETPSKGKMTFNEGKATSMGLLIPPTPRGPSSVAVSQTPSTTRKMNVAQPNYLETPLSQSLSSLSQVLPSPAVSSQLRSFSTPSISLTGTPLRTSSVNGAIGTQGRAAQGFSRVTAPNAFLATSVTQTPSTLARNRVAVASSWMNDFDEAALVQDLANAVSGASVDASPLQTHSPRAHRMGTPNSEPGSLNSSVERGRESDSSPTPFLRQLSSGTSTPSTHQLNQSGNASAKSGRKGRRSQEKKDLKKCFDTPSNALFGSPFALHSQQAIVNLSPLVQAPSPVSTGTHNGQHRSSSTPRSRHSDLRSQSSSSTPLTHLSGTYSAERRDSGVSAHQLLYPLGSSSVVASPASSASSPSMSVNHSGRKRGKVVRGAETGYSRSGPSTPRSSTPSASNMERRQSVIMDELAEQIIDIMGSAGLSTKNLSPSDLTKHTMAILGIKSPQISMDSQSSTGKTASRVVSKVDEKTNFAGVSGPASSSSAPISRRESSSSSIEAQIPISVSGVVHKKKKPSSRPSLHQRQVSSSSTTHQRVSSAASAEERSRSSKNGHSHLSSQSISNGFLLAEMDSKRKSFGLDDDILQGSDQGDELSQTGKKSWVAQIDSALDQLDQSFSSATDHYGGLNANSVHSDEETWQDSENDSPNASFSLEDAGLDEVEEMLAKKEHSERMSSVHGKRNIQTLQDAFMPSNAFCSGTSSLDVSISLLEAQLAEIEADKSGEEGQIEDDALSHTATEEWNDEEQDELERELARLAAEESQGVAMEEDENLENDEDVFVNDVEAHSEYSQANNVVEEEDDELALELERLAREEAEQMQNMIDLDVDAENDAAEHENGDNDMEEFGEEEEEVLAPEEIEMDHTDVTSLSGTISQTITDEDITICDQNIEDVESAPVPSEVDEESPENLVDNLPASTVASSTRSSLSSITETLGHHGRLSSSSDLSNGVGKDAKSLLSTKSLFQANKTFSLEPLLFDYPSPARHVGVPYQSSPLEGSEETDFSSTSSSVVLLPTHLADSSFIEDEVDGSLHASQPSEALISDLDHFELSPPSAAFPSAPQQSSRPGTKPNHRLNLSINPDEDENLLPASSPGFDRIKKVLDFVS